MSSTLEFSLNHMTAAATDCAQLLELAQNLKCRGVEFRTDVPKKLFGGLEPIQLKEMLQRNDLACYGLAELSNFDAYTDNRKDELKKLLLQAKEIGAQSIVLIPCNDGSPFSQKNFKYALQSLYPLLKDANLLGLIEPLGFQSSSIRLKEPVVEAIQELNISDQFKLVHDTFHHHLSGEINFYPEHTAIVHLSGVPKTQLLTDQLTDSDRGLVEHDDRLKSVEQISHLLQGGYSGPFSFEAFSPKVHSDPNLVEQISRSIEYINNTVFEAAA